MELRRTLHVPLLVFACGKGLSALKPSGSSYELYQTTSSKGGEPELIAYSSASGPNARLIFTAKDLDRIEVCLNKPYEGFWRQGHRS